MRNSEWVCSGVKDYGGGGGEGRGTGSRVSLSARVEMGEEFRVVLIQIHFGSDAARIRNDFLGSVSRSC